MEISHGFEQHRGGRVGCVVAIGEVVEIKGCGEESIAVFAGRRIAHPVAPGAKGEGLTGGAGEEF